MTAATVGAFALWSETDPSRARLRNSLVYEFSCRYIHTYMTSFNPSIEVKRRSRSLWIRFFCSPSLSLALQFVSGSKATSKNIFMWIVNLKCVFFCTVVLRMEKRRDWRKIKVNYDIYSRNRPERPEKKSGEERKLHINDTFNTFSFFLFPSLLLSLTLEYFINYICFHLSFSFIVRILLCAERFFS